MTLLTEHGSVGWEILGLIGPDSVALIILSLLLYFVTTDPTALRAELRIPGVTSADQ